MRTYKFNQDALPICSDISCAGITLHVSTNSVDILTSLSLFTASGAPRDRSLDLEIFVDPVLKRDPDAPMYFRGLRHLVFAVLSANEAFVFDLLRRRITGVVSFETARDGGFWTTRIIPIVLGIMGITVGLAPLHCACLDLNGDGLLIGGPSLSGKSTLAVSLARRGFALVSDGWTYLSKTCGTELTAHGVPVPVKLLPDAPDFFPELQGFKPAKAFNGEIAIEVDPRRTWNANARSKTKPRWLVILEKSRQGTCEIVPLCADAVRDFFMESVELLPPPLANLAEPRSRLIADLSFIECWKMRYGGSPHEAAEMIHHQCERGKVASAANCAVS